MPFLRFSRDTRGYENTYVLHGLRSGERAGPRLLYWFRTPPNVRVGRLPLDETAIRAIEESNPELTFDWTKMLKVKAQMPPAPSSGRSSARRSGGGRAAAARAARPAAASEPGQDAAAPDAPVAVAATDAVDVDAVDIDAVDIDDPGIDDPDIDAADGGAVDAEDAASRHPVAALVGDDVLARLRARYAELRARVAEKKVTPSAREVLEARVEALNPDAWRAGEAVVKAMERFEADVEDIRKTLGRRSRRRRSRAGRGGAARSGADAGRGRTGDATEGASTALEGSHEGPESV